MLHYVRMPPKQGITAVVNEQEAKLSGGTPPQYSNTWNRLRVARIVGALTHPVVLGVPVVIVTGVHELGWPSLPLMIMGLTTFFASIGLPIFVIWQLHIKGVLRDDPFLFRRENRVYIYPIILMGFVVDIALFTWLVPLRVGLAMSWAGLVTSLLMFLINFVTKISVHSASAAALFMGALTIYGKEALLFVPVLPLVIWARVTARNHTLSQTILGMGVAAATVWILMFTMFPDINKMTWQNVQSYRQNPPEYWLPFSGRPQ